MSYGPDWVNSQATAPQDSVSHYDRLGILYGTNIQKYRLAILLPVEEILPKRGFGHGARNLFTSSRKFTACSLLALFLRGMSEGLEGTTTNDVVWHSSGSTMETVDTCEPPGQPPRIYGHDMAVDTNAFILRHSS